MSEIIADLFQSYQKMVIPSDAPPIQIRECKLAFYAGAHGLFYTVMNRLSEGEEVTQEDENLLESIADELENFAESMKALSVENEP